jgi:hypothetical protein
MPDVAPVEVAESQHRIKEPGGLIAAQSYSSERAPRLAREPLTRLVQVRLSLLRDLEKHQKDLDAYITGYLCSRDMDEECQRVGSRLELGTKEVWRLGDSHYWTDIRQALTDLYQKSFALPALVRSDFEERIKAFEARRSNVTNIAAGPAHSPGGANVFNIANEALRGIESMRDELVPISMQAKQKADRALIEIGNVIKSIFDLIESTTDIQASESSSSSVTSEVRKQQAITREKPSSAWADRGPIHPDTIGYSPK